MAGIQADSDTEYEGQQLNVPQEAEDTTMHDGNSRKTQRPKATKAAKATRAKTTKGKPPPDEEPEAADERPVEEPRKRGRGRPRSEPKLPTGAVQSLAQKEASVSNARIATASRRQQPLKVDLELRVNDLQVQLDSLSKENTELKKRRTKKDDKTLQQVLKLQAELEEARSSKTTPAPAERPPAPPRLPRSRLLRLMGEY